MEDIKAINSDLERRMEGAIQNLKHALNGLRTGRVSTALLDPIKVEVYGDIMPINQLGTITSPDPKMLVVQVWDRAVAKDVEKAILNSSLGLNPIAEGQVIRVPIPDLSEQRRKELSKKASEYGEGAKIAIRNVRRDVMDNLKKSEKAKEISEDELHTYSENVQKFTDKYIKKIDETVQEKTRDIMAI